MNTSHYSKSMLLTLMGSGCAFLSLNSLASDPPVPVPSGVVVLNQAPPAGGDPALAANFPDKYAWKLFTSIIQKAPKQVKVENGLSTNDAVWETWADDLWTFPLEPDPANPPQWPADGAAQKGKTLKKGFASHAPKAGKAKAPAGPTGPDVGDKGGEEVRRNRATFDYIINNNLWYQQGIAAFFKKVAASSNFVEYTQRSVNLPIDALEVKANWVPILEDQKKHYHWNLTKDGQLLGLVAMHISSKALPNWFWCTFEWAGNPGRGDYIGIHDSFGLKKPHTPSNTDALNKTYPAGELTDELLAMFKEAGIEGDWAKEWQNYRLKGSQIDFTDATGRPLLLGNSVTEAGFVPTASCITCHSRSAVTSAGVVSYPLFGEKSSLPLVNIPQVGAQTIQNPSVVTYNGPPDPAWFFQFSGGPSTVPTQTGLMGDGTQLLNMPTDFVWAIPMNASPAKTSPKPKK